MADLSFLFQKTQPKGAMAGYESGYNMAQEDERLNQSAQMADYQASMAEKNRALLPTDIKKAQWETKPDVQQAGLDATQAGTRLAGAQADKMLSSISQEHLDSMQANLGKQLDLAGQMAQQGMGGQDIYEGLEAQILEKINSVQDPKEAKVYENYLRQLRQVGNSLIGMSPQQVLQSVAQYKEMMFQNSDAFKLENLRGQFGLRAASARNKPSHGPMSTDQLMAQAIARGDTATQERIAGAWQAKAPGFASGTSEKQLYDASGKPIGPKVVTSTGKTPAGSTQPTQQYNYVNGKLVPVK